LAKTGFLSFEATPLKLKQAAHFFRDHTENRQFQSTSDLRPPASAAFL
jgi:hypothetical protein